MQKTHRPSPTQAHGLRAQGKAYLMVQQTKKKTITIFEREVK
jgi:hypothetical protein